MYDLIIEGGILIDGTGAPREKADIGVSGDRIAAIGTLQNEAAVERIDASGMVVAPGFIDVHTHDDHALLSKPDMSYKASQGVSTVVAGNCGISLAPLLFNGDSPPPPMDLLGDGYRFPKMAEFFKALDETPPALNAALLCGHTTLRVGAMGEDLNRGATDDEIAAMRENLAEALDAGAIGMSTGLYYPPANAAPTEEVIRLAELLGPAGALYTTHLRDEGAHLQDSMEEAFEIGRASGAKVVLSHHKAAGAANFGGTRASLALFEKIRAQQKVTLDVYPYDASSTVLSADRVAESRRVIVTWSKVRPDVAGRDLDEIAREMDCSPQEAADALLPAGAIYFMMDEEDVQRVLKYPHAMVASDGLPHDVFPHPRLWGTFPRVLGHYSRDLGLMTLEDAVHRMSGLPATEFGLTGRGTVAVGSYADITLFDADTVIDRADFAHPTEPAAGIERVFVNGKAVWQNGKATGARPGRALRRQALQAAASD